VKRVMWMVVALTVLSGCAVGRDLFGNKTALSPAEPKEVSVADAQTAFENGVAAYRQEKYHEAVGHFENAIKIDPMLPEAHLDLGLALYHVGRVKEAKQQLDLAGDLLAQNYTSSNPGLGGAAQSRDNSSSGPSNSNSDNSNLPNRNP